MSRDPQEVADTFAAKAGQMQDASLYIYDAEALYFALRKTLTQLADARAKLASAVKERDAMAAVVTAAQELEKFAPTPKIYVGGQSQYSMHRHTLALRLKNAIAAIDHAALPPERETK